jgi:hypothetical protein
LSNIESQQSMWQFFWPTITHVKIHSCNTN